MNLEHRPNAAAGIPMVSASKVPGDRKPNLRCCLEHNPIPPGKLLRRHPTAERVVDMRISARLVQQHLAALDMAFGSLRRTPVSQEPELDSNPPALPRFGTYLAASALG